MQIWENVQIELMKLHLQFGVPLIIIQILAVLISVVALVLGFKVLEILFTLVFAFIGYVLMPIILTALVCFSVYFLINKFKTKK